jgi:hypothetical protein
MELRHLRYFRRDGRETVLAGIGPPDPAVAGLWPGQESGAGLSIQDAYSCDGQHDDGVGGYGILRVESQDAIPNGINERRQGHGCAGVTGLGCLDGINGESADRVDRKR